MDGQLNTNRYFIGFVLCTVAAIATNFFSFVSPFWIQSVPSAHSNFVRIGLWTACFDGYMRPYDYYEAYFGCYYIYSVEYDRIREWINPIWFYAVQVISSCGILIQFLVTFMVLCQTTNSIDRQSMIVAKVNLIGHFLTSVAISSTLVAFAVARYDSTWMPSPQLNVLSWSYAIAVLSLLLTLIAFILGFIRYLYLDVLEYGKKAALLDNQYDEDDDKSQLRPGTSHTLEDYPGVVDTSRPQHSGDIYNKDFQNEISQSEFHESSRYNPQPSRISPHSSRGFG